MNTGMYENPVTQDNLKLLEKYGMEVITPANGWLACGDVGAGKMPEPEDLFEYILKCIAIFKPHRRWGFSCKKAVKSYFDFTTLIFIYFCILCKGL